MATNTSKGTTGTALNGGNGMDTLYGTAGNDTMSGGNGKDTLYGNDGNDSINGDGATKLDTSNGIDLIYGGAGNDTIKGGNGGDLLNGDDGNDSMSGDNGSDLMAGGVGNDIMAGGNDNDTMTGGAGADLLTGGAGADVYRYLAATDSNATAMDTVTDFDTLRDVLDLSVFYAANHALHVGTHAGTSAVWTTQSGGNTYVHADTDGDGTEDLLIKVQGLKTIGLGNFTDMNDAPTLGAVAAGSVAEVDQSSGTTTLGLSGTLAGADPENDALTYGVVNGAGAYGTLSVDSSTGAYEYTPNAAAVEALDDGESATESFTVWVSDGFQESVTSRTYLVTVTGADDPPELAAVGAGSIAEVDQSTSVTSSGLDGTLSASDVDGDALTYGVEGGSASDVAGYDSMLAGAYGTVYVNATTGAYQYVMNAAAVEALGAGETASDSFTMSVGDGDGPAVTQAYVVNLTGAAEAAPPSGTTPGDDLFYGTEGPDSINGQGGNDTLYGLGGDDTIIGGSGRDVIYGGDGNDGIQAGQAGDYVDGGNGDDSIQGGQGDDTLRGNGGNDTIAANEGDDYIAFEASGAANGTDSIANFRFQDDQLAIPQAFFSPGGGTFGGTVVAGSTGNVGIGGAVVLYEAAALTDAATAAQVAGIVNGSALNIGAGDHAVLVTGTDHDNMVRVWYVENDATANVEDTEVTLVAVIDLQSGSDDIGVFTAASFVFF